MNKYSNNTGFTLTELLVTLVIMGLLATLAVPSFMNMLKRQEAERTMDNLRPMFVEARMIALTRRQHVVVCPTLDQQTCDKSSSVLMSFIDTNANLTLEPTEEVISQMSSALKFGELRFNVGLGREHIRYFPDTGRPRGYFANVTYCPSDGDMTYARAIILNEHGRARKSHDKNKDGVHERGGGRALRC